MAWVWCTYLPHLVHLLTFLSLLGYVSPSRVSLPCYGSFVAAREFGWSKSVLWETKPKRERKVSKSTRWGGSVHHTHASTPHATLACATNKSPCHSQLTNCVKESMTWEGGVLWET